MSEPTPEALVANLLRLLQLKALGDDRFEGPRRGDGVGRVFGGQVIAQALVAAQASVPEDRPAHSLHASSCAAAARSSTSNTVSSAASMAALSPTAG